MNEWILMAEIDWRIVEHLRNASSGYSMDPCEVLCVHLLRV